MLGVTAQTLADEWGQVVATVRRDPVRMAASAAGFLILLALPVWMVFNLDRGLDVSDSGYYHASISYLTDNQLAVTQFGVIWNLLPLPDDILVRRLAIFVLVSLACAWMTIEAFWLVTSRSQHQRLGSDQLLFAGVGIGAGIFYAPFWLTDPSYNSMTIGLCCALVALALQIARQRARSPVGFVAAGMLIVFLLYVRPQTALALGVLLALLVLALARPRLPELVKITGLAVAGMIGAVGLIWLVVEAPWVTWARFQGGLELADVLARDVDQLDRLERFSKRVLAVVTGHWYLLAWAFAASALPAFKPLRGGIVQSLLVLSLSFLLVGVIGYELRVLPDQARAFYGFHGESVALVGLVALAVAIGRVVANFNSKARRLETRRLAVVVVLVLTSVAAVFWTGSLWFPRLAWVGVFVMLALVVAIHSEDRWHFVAGTGSAVAVLVMMQVAFWTVASQTPYRLPDPLMAQTIQTDVRHGRSTLRTDQPTHDLLTALTAASRNLAGCEGDARPVLLDMTGRMPMVAYHINARPPGRSWVLSGYPGSPDLFRFIVGRLDDATLQSAWILDAPDYTHNHDADVLAERGIDFRQDYDRVLDVYTPYPDTQLRLYRPKGGVACASR